MKRILLLNLLLLTISCRDQRIDSVTQNTASKPDTAIQNASKAPLDVPTRHFITIVRMLDSLGFKSDTIRVAKIKNYNELLNCEIQIFNEYPFYKMNKENSKVLWWNTLARDKTDSIDTEVFRKAQSLWGYYYQKKERENMTTDGVIEQWMFSDSATSQTAIQKLNAGYPRPFFNTQPYYITHGQYLFIFHTRADAFSYRQKDFFDKFRKITSSANNKP